MTGLRGALAAFAAFALLPTSAAAEHHETGDAGDANTSQSEAEGVAVAPLDPSIDWWKELRGKLFDGVPLSDEQNMKLDGIVEGQLERRAHVDRLVQGFNQARDEGDRERIKLIGSELREQRTQLRPQKRIDEMRDVLAVDQVATFETNLEAWQEEMRSKGQQRQRRQRQPRPAPAPATEQSPVSVPGDST